MKKKYLLFFVFIFSALTFVSAQNNKTLEKNKKSLKQFGRSVQIPENEIDPNGVIRCYSNQNEALLKAKYPNRKSTQEFEEWLAPKIQEVKRLKRLGRMPSVITIPVVVHIIHNETGIGNENISDAQVLSQIQVFNEDFRKMTGTPGDGAGVDTMIEFCMAQVDPNGNPTNGIDRRFFTAASYDGAAVEANKAVTIWDPTKYLNMWTYNFGGDLAGVLGYAQFPTGSGLEGMPAQDCITGEASTDGVVCAYTTWGSRTIAPLGTYGAPYDRGRTMTHEVGHMFGLRHIWGDGGCGVDDFCADTPESDAANFGCPTTHVSCGTLDMVRNYMDYTDDTCMNLFTQDQSDRMLAVLMNSPRRDDLLVSTVCNPVSTPYIQFKREACEARPVKSVIEGNGCSFTEFTIPLNIEKAPSANATVTFSIDGASIADASDIQIMTPTVTFTSGSTADRNLVFRVLNDGVVESDEELIISFTVNANGGDAVANTDGNTFSMTIVNDDTLPTLTVNSTLINEDFEDLTGWLIIDGDGDTRNWGSVTGLDGFGTVPNTLSGTCVYSEKRIGYFGGATSTANPNNYLISPQITIPSGASVVNLSYIVGAYDNGGPTRNAGNFSVYFTNSIASEAAILAGTLVQSNLVINENTTQLRNNNLLALSGQTGYLVFRHNNTSATNVGLLLLDSVLLQATSSTLVQTEVNAATLYQSAFTGSGNFVSRDVSNNNIMSVVNSASGFDYGCTTIEVDRSNTSVGAAITNFIDPALANRILSKTFYVDPTNDTASGNFTISLYFTEAEIAAWESATGNLRSQLRMFKVKDAAISSVTYANFTDYVIEEVPVSISAFGTDVVLQASFTSEMRGGYAVGASNGINCGDFATTWDGSAWSNGSPLKNTSVTITGNYSSSSDLEACSVTITNNAQVTINSGDTFIVDGDVTVVAGSSLTVENNAALRQIDDAAVNTGSIIVKRNATVMNRLDYTAWSTPVVGQQLQAFSPNTVSTRFYEYLFTGVDTPTAYQSVDATTNFVAGKGYMIRADNTYTGPTVFNGQFTGVPINGIVNQSVGLGYNVLGNPYPSPVDANTFLTDNTNIGALYFWTNTTAASGGIYPQNNFATYTSGAGGVAAFASGKVPNGTIQTGQGFYVQATSAGSASFNNLQREDASVSTQFYRNASTSSLERHRIWLNLNDSNTSYNQILVGYIEGASNGVDFGIDAKVLDTSKPMLYNIVNNEEYVIQGKSLPFNDEDIVPLGLKALTAGAYTISIENVDGLFDNQDVFIKDKLNNIIHDLKSSAYSFTTQEGTFNNRFEIVYKSGSLSSDEFTNANTMDVFVNSNEIHVNSSKENINEIIVFDVLGRKLYENKTINANTFTISTLKSSNQALIVKVKLQNGQVKTEKIIL
ncbi:M43 family zinc metalloprotease [Flavobacterium sp.]|uniref:M43 family zinc metalloprotease n=1 Tax=Flavobacterium sp. TaxID=239 RepID=UPI003D2B379E